jgi:hypothetical protein
MQRRSLRLTTLDDLASEANRVCQSAANGRVQSSGNWSPAQVLWHVGKLIELSVDGFPFCYRRGPVWAMRLLRWISWHALIALAFRPGFRNPPYAAVLEPDPALSLADGAAFLRHQLERIRRGERMTHACSVDGAYTHDEWVYIHLRHAELHLSFLVIENEPDSENRHDRR